MKFLEHFDVERIKPKAGDKKWKFLTKAMIYSIFASDIGSLAAQLAYYLLFSLFPFLIFVNSLVSYFNFDPADVERFINSVMPRDAAQLIVGYYSSITAVKSPALTLLALFMVVYSSARALGVLLIFLSETFDKPAKLPIWISSVILSFFFVLYISAAASLTTLSGAVLSDMSEFFKIPKDFLDTWGTLRWVIFGGISFIIVTALYYIMPRGLIKYRHTIVPAMFCLAGWFAVSLLFSYYVNNYARYSLIYGSLGAVIALMLWLYFTSTVLLWGGQLSYILYLYRKREGKA